MSKIRKKVNNVKLTQKQQKFCDYYIELGNAKQAAIKAGYSPKTAKAIGAENLTKPYLKAYIDERLEEIKNERTADAQEVMEFLTSVMRGEIKEPVTVLDGDGYQKVVDLQPSVQTRRAAAVDIGKRYALFTDKVDLQQGDIVIKVGEWDAEDEED
ncbi:terminase small subunit [uncultured Vagococcus sp.]|uniref:terminase small subunit n=1 Tax=uncultured Vagococcus sp. TaxID=189676 RepID=UPI0025830171|nr:terminase small subunit [uncultured Vagococcus sp.]